MDDDEVMLKFEGFDDCITGRASVWDTSGQKVDRLIYSGEKIVETLVDRDGMEREDALEHIDFNMEGGYVGPSTPIIAWDYDPAMDDAG